MISQGTSRNKKKTVQNELSFLASNIMLLSCPSQCPSCFSYFLMAKKPNLELEVDFWTASQVGNEHTEHLHNFPSALPPPQKKNRKKKCFSNATLKKHLAMRSSNSFLLLRGWLPPPELSRSQVVEKNLPPLRCTTETTTGETAMKPK